MATNHQKCRLEYGPSTTKTKPIYPNSSGITLIIVSVIFFCLNIYMNNQITLADLAQIRNIINTACTRGAFKADEMRSVGEVYDRLAAFLDSVLEQAQQQQSENKEKNDD